MNDIMPKWISAVHMIVSWGEGKELKLIDFIGNKQKF